MSLVAAKCTECGANIEIDEGKEAGICKYCGTAFVTEKAINNYNMGVTHIYNGSTINVQGKDVGNLIKMAEVALEARNMKEATKYANEVLEVDISIAEAWEIKMRAIELIPLKNISIEDSKKLKEMESYGKNAIIYANNKKEMEEKIYTYIIQTASYIQVSLECDVSQRELENALNGISGPLWSIEEATNRSWLHGAAGEIIERIPDEAVQGSEQLQNELISYIDLSIQSFNGNTETQKDILISKIDKVLSGVPEPVKIQKRLDAKNKFAENVEKTKKKNAYVSSSNVTATQCTRPENSIGCGGMCMLVLVFMMILILV